MEILCSPFGRSRSWAFTFREQSLVIPFITGLVGDYSLPPVVKLCKPVLEVSRAAS